MGVVVRTEREDDQLRLAPAGPFDLAHATAEIATIPETVLLAKLDALRHQAFDEPLPFGDGLTSFEHLRRHVKRVVARLDCAVATGGGGAFSLPRHASIWGASTSNCRGRACRNHKWLFTMQKFIGYVRCPGIAIASLRWSSA